MSAIPVYRDSGEPAGGLVKHFNAATLWGLPPDSEAPSDPREQLEALVALGVAALQHPFPQQLGDSPLALIGMGRVDRPEDALPLAESHRDAGYGLTTLHVGHGLETDEERDRLLEAVLDASVRSGYPLFVETHRATVTQDLRRTLDAIERFPELRFNADLSHWYTGQEQRYGDFEARLAAMAPLFERVRYLHGRIGTAGCMQVPIRGPEDDRPFVEDFRSLWRHCIQSFKRTAAPGEALPFAAELLPYALDLGGGHRHHFYYARLLGTADDAPEECDRWQQAEWLWQLFVALEDADRV